MIDRIREIFFKDIFTTMASLIIVFFLISACVGEIYSIFCKQTSRTAIYDVGDMKNAYSPPSWKNPLGTDFKGRDVLLRAFFASKTAIKIGFLAGILSAAIGVAAGIISGYFGGFVDEITVWFYSSFASIPTLLFILAFSLLVSKGFLIPPLTSAFNIVAKGLNTDTGMLSIYIGIGMTGWVGLCRILRSETMRLRNEPYVRAAQILGLGNLRIILRHIFPNLAHIVIIYFSVRFSYAVMTEVIVSYLGLGVQSEPSWGVMIADGQMRLWRGVWWEITAATGFMFLLVLSLNILGDAVRDALDPKLKL
jgi:peptide/nickel transport system permease protein